jgi:sulfide:quinone oxidoreductase
MPPGNGWVLPLYELALFAANALDGDDRGRAQITVVTPERNPLEIFGPRAARQTSALLAERRIDLVAGAQPIGFGAGRLRIDPGEDIEADAAITLPRLEGRRIGGIPYNGDGFITVDELGRAVGLDRVYAAGDVSSLAFKQGTFASQQADTVAEAIAAAVGVAVEPRPAAPQMRAVLWTGQGPQYLADGNGAGNGKGSSPSQRHLELLHNGRLPARYLSPLVDSLLAGGNPRLAGSAAVEASQHA